MKKKSLTKIIAIGCVTILVGGAISGCGSEKTKKEDDGKTRIVLLLNGYLGDLAWYDCSAAGMKAIEEKYGNEVETKIIEMTTD